MSREITDKNVMQMAFDALKEIHVGNMTPMAEENWNEAIKALRKALAQPEQELDYPPECTTPELEVAYAAGWWKALEVQRNKQQALDKKADNARELGLDYESEQKPFNRLIRIMGTFDLATGHADNWDDLLDSLESELHDVLGHYREALKQNHGFDRTASHMAKEYMSTNQQNVNTSEERVYKMCICEHIQRCTVFDKCMKEC